MNLVPRFSSQSGQRKINFGWQTNTTKHVQPVHISIPCSNYIFHQDSPQLPCVVFLPFQLTREGRGEGEWGNSLFNLCNLNLTAEVYYQFIFINGDNFSPWFKNVQNVFLTHAQRFILANKVKTLTELVDFTAAKARQTERIWQKCTLLCVRLSVLINPPSLTFPRKQQGLLGDP